MKKDVVFEALKEIARWGVLFAMSWFITETLKQAVSVPEFYILKVWLFVYMIPVRVLFTLGLTALGRIVDRWIHDNPSIKADGLLPF